MNDDYTCMSSEDFDFLLVMIEFPPKPSQALRDLIVRETPWEIKNESTTRIPRRRRGRRSVVVGRRTARDVLQASRVEGLKATDTPHVVKREGDS